VTEPKPLNLTFCNHFAANSSRQVLCSKFLRQVLRRKSGSESRHRALVAASRKRVHGTLADGKSGAIRKPEARRIYPGISRARSI
jgi:hypothetical protein